MTLEPLALAAFAALAFGAGLNIAPAQADPNCSACLAICDRQQDACLAAGTSPAVCRSRANLCRYACEPECPPTLH